MSVSLFGHCLFGGGGDGDLKACQDGLGHLLAPTGYLIVTVVYYVYIDPQASNYLKFRAFLPIYLVFLSEN